jgi:diaminopropionate ammonia-lyase
MKMEYSSEIRWVFNNDARLGHKQKASAACFSAQHVRAVRSFHNGFYEYSPTPLFRLDALAQKLGVAAVWVKDESARFGLNAFKVLGGCYAIGRYLAEKLGINIEGLTFEKLNSAIQEHKLQKTLFVTATDGNHGRGIAWAAARLGQDSVVFLPRGAAAARVTNIRKEGAKAIVLDMNYDNAVVYAKDYADKHNGVFVQDTSCEGYTEMPRWIMQGYGTIADEIIEQLKAYDVDKPSHIFLQAGVGSFAASMLAYFTDMYHQCRPVTAIVEPNKADCIYKSASMSDGRVHEVTGDLDTIMAGLACGRPNALAWEILRDYADMFFSCPDYVSALGTRILANPVDADPRIISGESGSVGVGLVALLLRHEKYRSAVKQLDLNGNSMILFISTEGDTDPVGYRKIVWDGFCATPDSLL